MTPDQMPIITAGHTAKTPTTENIATQTQQNHRHYILVGKKIQI